MHEKRLQSQKANHSQDKADEKISFLAQNTIFRDLNAEEINELDRMITTITCLPGRVLYRPGEAGSALFLLKSGGVQLYHLSTDGRKLITETLQPGAWFGVMPLIGQGIHNSFAEASIESRIYVINKHDMVNLLMHKPAVTYGLLQVFGQRLARMEAQLTDAAFKSTPARLATLLLQLALPQSNGTKACVVEGLSHEELADRLGVYRETVSTALRELKDAGAIELGRKHITISDPELLAALASSGNKGGGR